MKLELTRLDIFGKRLKKTDSVLDAKASVQCQVENTALGLGNCVARWLAGLAFPVVGV